MAKTWIYGMADYLNILEKELEKRGYKRDKENESLTLRKNGHVFSKEEHLKMFIYAQLSNQRAWEPIVPHLREIDKIFFDYEYDKVKAHSGEYYTNQIRAISCGNRSIHAQMDGLNANIHTFERLIEKYGSLDSFVLSEPAYNIVKILADPSSEYKMIQLGEALAWEYLRNVGIDGAKPDMHLRRFFGCSMLSVSDKEMAPIDVVLEEVDKLSETTGRNKFEIDYILWTSLSQGLCYEDEIRKKIFD